ncbi:MAG: glycosyltransferase family 4 protein [Kiritimatiellae bacterium]|nr:glycosyltransferase family 4 protein [Kiritimatiellia bacterium]
MQGLPKDKYQFTYLCPAFFQIETHLARVSKYCNAFVSEKLMQMMMPQILGGCKTVGRTAETGTRARSLKTVLIKNILPRRVDEGWFRLKLLREAESFFVEQFHRMTPDIVHIHAGSYSHVPGCVLAAARACPEARILVHLHNPPVFGHFSWIDRRIIRKHVDLILYASNSAQKDWAAVCRFNVPAIVLQNCVNTSIFSYRESERSSDRVFVWGTCARLTSVKGVDLMIDALRMLKSEGYDLRLHIIGEGGDRDKLMDQACRLGLQKEVVFFGEQDQVLPFLREMDGFLMASKTEGGVPMALLEAMAVGLPVVSTRAGGIMEALVDGVTGLSCETPDVHHLAGAMKFIMESPEQAAQFRRAGRERVVEHFDQERMNQGLNKIYQGII